LFIGHAALSDSRLKADEILLHEHPETASCCRHYGRHQVLVILSGLLLAIRNKVLPSAAIRPWCDQRGSVEPQIMG